MTGLHRDTGEIDRPYYPPPGDPRFRHAAGRAPAPPERPRDHLRAAYTGEQPAVQVFEAPDPGLWESCALWFAAIAAALALGLTGWLTAQVMQIRHAIEQPIVITTTPTTTPSK